MKVEFFNKKNGSVYLSETTNIFSYRSMTLSSTLCGREQILPSKHEDEREIL